MALVLLGFWLGIGLTTGDFNKWALLMTLLAAGLLFVRVFWARGATFWWALAVQHQPASRVRSGQSGVASAYLAVEIDWSTVEIVSVSLPLSGQGRFDWQVQQHCQVWFQASRGFTVQPLDQLPVQSPPVALVGHGRTGEPVCDHYPSLV
jgi:hypothetical protein